MPNKKIKSTYSSFPQVEFRIAPFEEVFPILDHILNPPPKDWDWSDSIYKHYPALQKKLAKCVDRKKRRIIAYQFFKDIFKKNKSSITKVAQLFASQWNKINDQVMLTLSELMEQKWPIKDKKFLARITLNPICPRWIKSRMFDLFYKLSQKKMKEFAIHEIAHFIYFEKWKSVFPKTDSKEFDAPHLVWHLSEMVPEIILNDPQIQNVFKAKFNSYQEYQNCKINGKPLLSYLQQYYDQRNDFTDFLKKSWRFVKKHEQKILFIS